MGPKDSQSWGPMEPSSYPGRGSKTTTTSGGVLLGMQAVFSQLLRLLVLSAALPDRRYLSLFTAVGTRTLQAV